MGDARGVHWCRVGSCLRLTLNKNPHRCPLTDKKMHIRIYNTYYDRFVISKLTHSPNLNTLIGDLVQNTDFKKSSGLSDTNDGYTIHTGNL